MGLFRRKREETLNEQLLREAGYDASGKPAAPPEEEPAAAPDQDFVAAPAPWLVGPPGPMDPRAGLLTYGAAARPRTWDVVTAAEAPELTAQRYEFATVPDGSLIVGDDCDEDLSPLADAVEKELKPPYRALAVRSDDRGWMVSARNLDVVALPVDGEELELTEVGGERHFAVDGSEKSAARAPAELVALGRHEGVDYVVQAQRLDGNLWEVTPTAL
ncbi:MAG: hypothetical protein QOE91_86 [Gaiellaceae bacterium]|nr:hypothetical protein [Gaiellaceae bacterium]